jgi:hypothetical protein
VGQNGSIAKKEAEEYWWWARARGDRSERTIIIIACSANVMVSSYIEHALQKREPSSQERKELVLGLTVFHP